MKKKLIIGFIFILISFLPLFNFNFIWGDLKGLLFFSFGLGVIIISESLTQLYYKESLIKRILSSKRNIISFFLVTFLAGFLLELFSNFLGRLWIFPYWSFTKFLFLFIPGYAFYWLVICESYLGTKSFLDYIIKGKKYVVKNYSWEKTFFKILGIVGIILLILSIVLIIVYLSKIEINIIDFTNINKQTSSPPIPFLLIILSFLGLFFFFEYVHYLEKKKSLTKNILHKSLSPIRAIIVSSLVLSVFMEAQNIIPQLWVYTNWPLPEVTFLRIPILIFGAWILHYVGFLSLFRILTDNQSSAIWSGDLIK